VPAISSYFTDIIRIVNVSTDKYGQKTQTESSDIKCRIEDKNELMTDNNGQEVFGEMEVIFGYDENFTYADKIKIIKKAGVDYQQPDKLWLIKKISQQSMFRAQYKYLVI
jgi:hypothetical protein